MGKEQRKRAVLRFMGEHKLALPPGTVYLNMRDRNVTFSERTVKRHLKEMMKEGYVERPYDGRPHYRITDKGLEYIRDSDN